MKKLLFFTLIFSMHITAYAEEAFSTLEERMSGIEFKQTGLVKLTDEELATLNEWIRSHSVATLENAVARPASGKAQAGSTEDMRGFENRPKDGPADGPDGKVIYGTIVGTFKGWNGKRTLFKLTNGMIWQQTETATFYVKPVENAEITIRKGLLGNWRLSMVGYNSAVSVKRVK